ncbi:unnamed protein product [Penicillium crustosum]
MAPSTTHPMSIGSVLNPDHTHPVIARTSIVHPRQVQPLSPSGSSFTAGSMHMDEGPARQYMMSSFVPDSRLESQISTELAGLVEQRTMSSSVPDPRLKPHLPTEIADRLDYIHSTSANKYDAFRNRNIKCSTEEPEFIRERINLHRTWTVILKEFNEAFPDRKSPSHQALRGRYYRYANQYSIPLTSYTDEQVWFIWLHRVFFEKKWNSVSKSFNERFLGRKISNIQEKFYREIKDNKIPSRNEVFLSFINRKGLIYPWMLEVFKPPAKFYFKSKLSAGIAGRCCRILLTSTKKIGSISNRLEYSGEELDFIWEESSTTGQDWDTISERFKKRFPYQKCPSGQEIKWEYYQLLNSDRLGLDQPSASYTTEEVWFLWFHRVFFEKQWDVVLESFYTRFPQRKPDTITRIQNDFSQKTKSEKHGSFSK